MAVRPSQATAPCHNASACGVAPGADGRPLGASVHKRRRLATHDPPHIPFNSSRHSACNFWYASSAAASALSTSTVALPLSPSSFSSDIIWACFSICSFSVASSCLRLWKYRTRASSLFRNFPMFSNSLPACRTKFFGMTWTCVLPPASPTASFWSTARSPCRKKHIEEIGKEVTDTDNDALWLWSEKSQMSMAPDANPRKITEGRVGLHTPRVKGVDV
mmetsp:Transcript_7145/g.16261  ORF Transcript_7145/g.16261 Transcript_7145/m.16261 type:complete len:219 (+) Transcript_7145:110-766(+)